MRVTSRALSKYRKALDAQADTARDYMERAIGAFEGANPGASVAEEREFTLDLLRAALPNFTEIEASLACEFFDELAEAQGWPEDVRSEIYDMTDYELVEEKVRYFADHLADGDAARFRREVADMTRYMVKRSAYDNMVRNCGEKGVRYARVPTGFETCSFCFMLASRGFVYRSEATAKGEHGYHVHCDCIVVPGVPGKTQIDGYDPEGMAERWLQCAKTAGIDPTTASPAKRRAIMREVETRDWHWLYTGESPKVKYVSERARLQTLQYRPHEDRTAHRLSELGFRCELGQDSKKAGKDSHGRTVFTGGADTSSGIEFKTVLTSKNAHGAVKNYFDSSLKKQNLKRMVIDNYESEFLSDESVIAAIRELGGYAEYREVFVWVSVLRKDGSLEDVIRR